MVQNYLQYKFSSNEFFAYDHVRKLKMAIILMKNTLCLFQF